MKRFVYGIVGLCASLAVAGCGKDENGNPTFPDVGGVCGFVCPGDKLGEATLEGIDKGNASISGIQTVDAFFSAVLSFETAANGVSGDGSPRPNASYRADSSRRRIPADHSSETT